MSSGRDGGERREGRDVADEVQVEIRPPELGHAAPPGVRGGDPGVEAYGQRYSVGAQALSDELGMSQITPSGGSITSAEASCPCHGIGSALMPLGFATFEPP